MGKITKSSTLHGRHKDRCQFAALTRVLPNARPFGLPLISHPFPRAPFFSQRNGFSARTMFDSTSNASEWVAERDRNGPASAVDDSSDAGIRQTTFLSRSGMSSSSTSSATRSSCIEEQKERLDQLTHIVLDDAQVRESTDEQLVRLPTGDGMALVFRHSAEEPARCALEIAEALRKHPETSGAHGHPQRSGERSDGCERAHQHRRRRDQHGAAGDGLRRCRAHPALAACGG